MTRWSVGFASVLAVIRYDPEYAEMGNPRGEIVEPRYYALAEDVFGNRRVWGEYHVSEAAAEAAYVALAPPIPFWEEVEPAYGSDAYAKNWREYEANQIDHEMKMEGRYLI